VELPPFWNVRDLSHNLAGRFVEQARIGRLLFEVPKPKSRGETVLGLTPRQAQALLAAYAADGDATAKELGEALGLDRSTLHGALEHLASRGWLERIVDPADGRRRRVVLLAAGREAAEQYVKAAQERLEEKGVPLDRI
jgi:DNA-binding MarR family transcriptional regulator